MRATSHIKTCNVQENTRGAGAYIKGDREMSRYTQEWGTLLEKLQNGHQEEIHGVQMEVKDIPDPMEGTVLDPRVYQNRKAEEEKGNPLAAYVEIPVQLIRDTPGYPNRDITSIEITKEPVTIQTRNGDTPVYLYRPAGGRDIKPVMVFFHGGAFIEGSTKTVENFCKILAELSDMLLVCVDYRLAPEHPFPEGLYDCYDTVNWVWEHADEIGADKNYLAVGGDSAGGTLAIGCCLLEREALAAGEVAKKRICYEALLYPGVLVNRVKLDDFKWRMADYEIPDDDLLAQGAAVSLKALTSEMARLYMGEDGPVKDPLAAPLCQESLGGLPKTLTVLCEYDYLRLSAEAFARKLERDGVENRTILYRGMDHAFIDKVGDYPQAYDAAVEIAKDMVELCGN